jgi:alternate signal-mediated exported protein
MHTTTKGAAAAGAAAVLLLGGAGTLAFWSDSATVNGGSINSGSLSINAGVCDPTWSYASGTAAGDPVVQGIVPGDSITKDCTFTVGAVGDHLSASPTVPSTVAYTPASLPGSTLTLPVSASYDLDGTPLTGASTITEADDGGTLTATITVTFPYGDATTINANDTQGLTKTLNGLAVTLTQTSTGENPNA